MSVFDSSEAAGEHNPLDVSSSGCFQNAQGAFAGRDDEVVFVLG
jgi:hypothetical protein